MKLSTAAVSKKVASLKGWTRKDDALECVMKFPAFADAIAFVTRLAFEAEANDHHPDLKISYRTVTVTWSTHSAGGVTDKDIDGAKLTNALAKRFGATSEG